MKPKNLTKKQIQYNNKLRKIYFVTAKKFNLHNKKKYE